MPRPGVGIGLVGRRAERAALTAALDRARAGRGGGVVLSGDAGVGKSRLVGELTAAAEGVQVLLGRCLDTAGSELPYLPFTEVAGQLVASDPGLGERHPGLLRLTTLDGGPDRGGRELGQLQVFDALLSALGAAAARRPVLLVLEDLHWADRSSRDLLVFLLSRLAEQRLLVVATYRADDLHRRHPLRPVLAELVRLPAVERLDLAPLPPEETFTLVRSLAAELGLEERDLRTLAERSEGNAFFAEELVSAAGGGGLPEVLADVLLTRFERLPGPAQQVLRVAAVAGRTVADDTLAQVSGLDPDEFTAAVREAVAHQVLVTDSGGELTFRHALLREAVYADLLPGERARLHAGYADLLAAAAGRAAPPGTGTAVRPRPGTAAALAHHALAAHDLPRALAASVRAAREADRVGAPAEVLRHAERAVELWPVVPDAAAVAGVDEVAVTLWATWSASASGDPDRGLALSRRALELVDAELSEGGGDPLRAAAVRIRHALRLLDRTDGGPAAAQTCREALALLRDLPPNAEQAWAHATLARAHWRTDEIEGFQEHGEAALRTARAALAAVEAGTATPSPDPGGTETDPVQARADALADLAAVEADALISLAVGEEFAGRGPRSRELLSEAMPQARESGNTGVELRIFYNRGMSFLEEGSLAEAVEEFAAGGRRALETGTTWSTYGIDIRVAQLVGEFMAGRWDAAERTARLGGARVAPAVAGRLAAAGLLVDVARGRSAEAEERWRGLDSRDQEDDQVVLLLGRAGIELARWRGESDEAVRRAETALADLRRIVPHHLASIALAALGLAALPTGSCPPRAPAPDLPAPDLPAPDLPAPDPAALDAPAPDPAAPDPPAPDHAAALLAAAEDAVAHGIPRSGSLGVEGRAWLVRARAEAARVRGTDDPELWTAVVEAFSYGEPYRRAEAMLRRAQACLEAAGPAARATATRWREAAAADLAEAWSTAEGLGATPLAAAVRETAERAGVLLGVDGSPGPAAGPVPSPLTPREGAVLRLVAEGRTNRQVGEVLFISEKTVSVHLSRVMAKLGAASRTEAVAIGYERGLIPIGHAGS